MQRRRINVLFIQACHPRTSTNFVYFDSIQQKMAADEAGILPPLVGFNAVHHVLEVCGFMLKVNCNMVIAEGFNQLSTFGRMSAKNFQNMSSKISKLAINWGGFQFGEVLVKNLEALAFWFKDWQHHYKLLYFREFTVVACDECLDLLDTEEQEITQAEAIQTPLLKFEVEKWVSWELKFMNHLAGIRGICGVPLSYVVCHDLPEQGHTFVTKTEKLIYEASLIGMHFNSDSCNIFYILKGVTVRTPAWS